MNDDDIFKTDEQEKWEEVREQAFEKTMDNFLDFLLSQEQLRMAGDLVHGLSYTHMTSWNKVDTCRCILWDGVLVPPEYDAQLNIEISVFGTNGGVGECRIYHHAKGEPLYKGWSKAGDPTAEDMIRQLRKEGCLSEDPIYYKAGGQFRKLKRDEVIKEGAMQSWCNGELQPIMGVDTVGQTPNDFSDERDFYNPIED